MWFFIVSAFFLIRIERLFLVSLLSVIFEVCSIAQTILDDRYDPMTLQYTQMIFHCGQDMALEYWRSAVIRI